MQQDDIEFVLIIIRDRVYDNMCFLVDKFAPWPDHTRSDRSWKVEACGLAESENSVAEQDLNY